jgi:lysophospholipase L1-like esterase
MEIWPLIRALLYALIFYGGYRYMHHHVYKKGGALPKLHPDAFVSAYGADVSTESGASGAGERSSPSAAKAGARGEKNTGSEAEGLKSGSNASYWSRILHYLRTLDDEPIEISLKKRTGGMPMPGIANQASADGVASEGETSPNPRPDCTVVCCGDSITHGNCSYDYVEEVRLGLLALQWPASGPAAIINAGINGDLAWNLLQRLDSVIACRPDYVTVLIGTNDINAIQTPALLKSFRKAKGLPDEITPDQDWYLATMREILNRLKSQTEARIAVFTIPLIGERTEDDINKMVNRYNEGLIRLCSELKITVLELNEAQSAYLMDVKDHKTRKGYDVRRIEREVKLAPWIRFVLLWDWERISRAFGYHTLIDGVHMNRTGGQMAAELLLKWLRRENS